MYRATSRRHFVSLIIGLAAAAGLPSIAQASALDQFKAFVAGTKSAKGEFTQRQVKTMDGATLQFRCGHVLLPASGQVHLAVPEAL